MGFEGYKKEEQTAKADLKKTIASEDKNDLKDKWGVGSDTISEIRSSKASINGETANSCEKRLERKQVKQSIVSSLIGGRVARGLAIGASLAQGSGAVHMNVEASLNQLKLSTALIAVPLVTQLFNPIPDTAMTTLDAGGRPLLSAPEAIDQYMNW